MLLYAPEPSSSGARLKTLLTTPSPNFLLLEGIKFKDKINVVDYGSGDDDLLLAWMRREANLI